MCSQYTLKFRSEDLRQLLPEIKLSQEFSIPEKALPSKEAPVIVFGHELLKLVKMKFSMVPSWSKEPKVKFATHNARIESVEECATWKSVILN